MKNAFFKWWGNWYALPAFLFLFNFLAAALAEVMLSLSRHGTVQAIGVFGAGLLGGAFGGGGSLLGAGLFAFWQRKNPNTHSKTSVSANGARQENGDS